ncbi:unnamed protein product [Prunus armeniaca]|uniref:Uncharacterized protein n=1 Tax=Prunus armeniaca TaxID=36596 RepID=A0A6J5UJT0_PRUAR|nr:unnamed protein product [Prunus armeniaca]
MFPDTNSLLCSYGNEETPVADLRQLRYFQPNMHALMVMGQFQQNQQKGQW